MKLFLDTEFNSFGGNLISLALVPESGPVPPFYEVLECLDPHPWVAEHVMPILGKAPISLEMFQRKLEAYLQTWWNCVIVADWPEDIAYLCKAMTTGPGTRIAYRRSMHFQLIDIDAPSSLPHNALADAEGMLNAYAKQQLPPSANCNAS
jgi:hypothetical protein